MCVWLAADCLYPFSSIRSVSWPFLLFSRCCFLLPFFLFFFCHWLAALCTSTESKLGFANPASSHLTEAVRGISECPLRPSQFKSILPLSPSTVSHRWPDGGPRQSTNIDSGSPCSSRAVLSVLCAHSNGFRSFSASYFVPFFVVVVYTSNKAKT